MLGVQVDRTADSKSELGSRWASKSEKNPNQNESDGLNSKSSGRGKRGSRTRSFNPRRVPRGRAQKESGDEDELPQADKGNTSGKNLTETAGNKIKSLQLASSQSETSEEDEDEDDDDDDDEEEEEEDDEDEEDEDEHSEDPDREDKNHETSQLGEQAGLESKGHENGQIRQQAQDIGPSSPKHNHERKPKPDHQEEPQLKSNQKREPYVRKVELPRERLSAADLEAKMAAMALKNTQLMEQKKAADQDAAEYREIELKSQQAFEAQRDQQKAIDAAREIAAKRKLSKSQGREWDFEKSEDDWNRSRPYTDSMTNPNPGKNSWYASRGSGSRARPPRGPHNSGRGRGRGGKRGGRGMDSWQGQKTEEPQTASPDRAQAPMENQSPFDQGPVPS